MPVQVLDPNSVTCRTEFDDNCAPSTMARWAVARRAASSANPVINEFLFHLNWSYFHVVRHCDSDSGSSSTL